MFSKGWDVLVKVLQRNRTNRLCMYLLFIHLKVEANMTMEAGKSKAFRTGWQARHLRKTCSIRCRPNSRKL